MSIDIYQDNDYIYLNYLPRDGINYIYKDFNNKGFTSIRKTFYLSEKYLVEDENDDDAITFIIGKLKEEYFYIEKNILRTDHDVLFHKSCSISTKYFLIKSISILSRMEILAKQQIIIGGELENSIPESEFRAIINSLPSKTELDHYTNSRITDVISQYLINVKDSRKAFENYLEKRNKIGIINSIPSINRYEYDKYSFILETLTSMIPKSNIIRESDWQDQILEIILILYPKYIARFKEVIIKDYYSDKEKT